MRILVFGDSISYGVGTTGGGWVQQLRHEFDQQKHDGKYDAPSVYNLSVAGDSSNEVVARFESETAARNKYGELAFIFAIGVNDSRIKPEGNFSEVKLYERNLHELHRQAGRIGRKIMFVGLTPCIDKLTQPVAWGDTIYINARIRSFNEVLAAFTTSAAVPFVEIYEPFSNLPKPRSILPDGLHPNDAGHNFVFERLRPALKKEWGV